MNDCVIINDKKPLSLEDQVSLQAKANELQSKLPQSILPTDKPIMLSDEQIVKDLELILKTFTGCPDIEETWLQVKTNIEFFFKTAIYQKNIPEFAVLVDITNRDRCSLFTLSRRWLPDDKRVKWALPFKTMKEWRFMVVFNNE